MARVSAWVEEERTAEEERDRTEREEREQEESERREREEQEERDWAEAERLATETEPESKDAQMHDEHHPPPSSSSPPKAPQPPKTMLTERSGLCVICQDQEANIAIVDCG